MSQCLEHLLYYLLFHSCNNLSHWLCLCSTTHSVRKMERVVLNKVFPFLKWKCFSHIEVNWSLLFICFTEFLFIRTFSPSFIFWFKIKSSTYLGIYFKKLPFFIISLHFLIVIKFIPHLTSHHFSDFSRQHFWLESCNNHSTIQNWGIYLWNRWQNIFKRRCSALELLGFFREIHDTWSNIELIEMYGI